MADSLVIKQLLGAYIGTAAAWAASNIAIDMGVFCYESDTKLLKIGDGTSLYSVLTYINKPVSSGGVPVGTHIYHNGIVAPDGYLIEDGSAISRLTFVNLFNVITLAAPATSISIASPGVITWTAHGRKAGDPVAFETTGALPTGLAVGTQYYISVTGLTTDTFQVSTTVGGTSVVTTGTQTGTQTCRYTPWGCGDGINTFNLPNDSGIGIRGIDNGRGLDPSRVFGSYQSDANASHTHTVTDPEHGHSVSDPGHGHSISDPGHYHTLNAPLSLRNFSTNSGANGYYAASGINTNSAVTGISIYGNSTGISISNHATGISIAAAGGTETRGKNIAKLPCVKY